PQPDSRSKRDIQRMRCTILRIGCHVLSFFDYESEHYSALLSIGHYHKHGLPRLQVAANAQINGKFQMSFRARLIRD
ncbi:MAG: hypothetical protein KJS68_09900, partial [Alphaproteobacteria bacterium]|nr:hypothetical protein [Alphaproteobacteria bacterium]